MVPASYAGTFASGQLRGSVDANNIKYVLHGFTNCYIRSTDWTATYNYSLRVIGSRLSKLVLATDQILK